MTKKMAGPRFDQTYCSQCGSSTGPGDCGFSACAGPGGHVTRALRREHASLVAAAKELQTKITKIYSEIWLCGDSNQCDSVNRFRELLADLKKAKTAKRAASNAVRKSEEICILFSKK